MEEYIPLNESKEAYELAADIQRSDLSEYGLFLTRMGMAMNTGKRRNRTSP